MADRTAAGAQSRADRRPRRERPPRAPGAALVATRRDEAQTSREWIVARNGHVCRRDLPPPGDAELLPQDVGVSLRRSRRDAEANTHLLVRAPGGDELDDFPLLGVIVGIALFRVSYMGGEATGARPSCLVTEGSIFGHYAGRSYAAIESSASTAAARSRVSPAWARGSE